MNEDIRDIHGPIVEAIHHPWWPYAVLVIAIGLLAIAIAALIVRHRRRALPADVRALRQLAAARSLVQDQQPQAFSSQISAIVRGYVEEAFSIHAPRRTTEELLTELFRVSSPVAPYRSELGSFLELCDLAKYARSSLSAEQMTTMVDRAEEFVRATAEPKPAAAGVS